MNDDRKDEGTESTVQDLVNGLKGEYSKEIRRQAVQQTAKWTLAGLVVLVGVAGTGWWLYLEPRIGRYIAAQAEQIPADAVVAFDRKEGCPEGWTDIGKDDHNRFAGRFLLVAGPPAQRGAGSTDQRAFDDQGGLEAVALTIPQMPKHRHLPPEGFQHWWYKNNGNANHRITDEFNNRGIEGAFGQVDDFKMQDEGGDEEHENMPPFIALHFCKKDAVRGD